MSQCMIFFKTRFGTYRQQWNELRQSNLSPAEIHSQSIKLSSGAAEFFNQVRESGKGDQEEMQRIFDEFNADIQKEFEKKEEPQKNAPQTSFFVSKPALGRRRSELTNLLQSYAALELDKEKQNEQTNHSKEEIYHDALKLSANAAKYLKEVAIGEEDPQKIKEICNEFDLALLKAEIGEGRITGPQSPPKQDIGRRISFLGKLPLGKTKSGSLEELFSSSPPKNV